MCTYSRQWSRVNHATIRAQERNALQIFRQNWPFGIWNCTYFGDNHSRDTESRQLPKITAQGENHGNHGYREFVIYIHPYWSHFRYLKLSLRMRRVTWPLTRGKTSPHLCNPWLQFAYSYCHFHCATTKIKPWYKQKMRFPIMKTMEFTAHAQYHVSCSLEVPKNHT